MFDIPNSALNNHLVKPFWTELLSDTKFKRKEAAFVFHSLLKLDQEHLSGLYYIMARIKSQLLSETTAFASKIWC